MIKRIFYCSGPGDIIESHKRWSRGEHNPTEVSQTFSGQIADFCRDINASSYFVSTYPKSAIEVHGAFTLEHRPKRTRKGALFHLGEITYGLGLLRTAVGFRADVALVDSGCTHYFVLLLFRALGILVVPILHNTLWPNGFPPRKIVPRIILALDSMFFWRATPTAVIAVSPECERQVDSVRRKKLYQVFQTRAQFDAKYFSRIPPPPPHDRRPFRVMYIGRIDRIKGVFDILEMAGQIEREHPGLICWEICGRGPDFDELVTCHRNMKMDGVVLLRGWTSLDELVEVYARSHASIVPTRSSFSEGLAMTAAEAILAGRPVITNPVVPALEILRDACVEAMTDDVDSHIRATKNLVSDEALYARVCASCRKYQPQFYDRTLGLAAVLNRALERYPKRAIQV